MATNWTISSDCVGLGGPERLVQGYGGITQIGGLGVEVICLRGGWQPFTNRNSPLKVDGWHGPVDGKNGERQLLDMALAGAMVTRQELVNIGRRQGGYLLVHQRHVADNDYDWWEKGARGQVVYVENCCEPDSLELTIRAVAGLRERGVSARVLVDLVHYYKEIHQMAAIVGEGVENNLKRMLADLSRILEKEKYLGMHLPLGTRKVDSLPFEAISGPFWKIMAKFIVDGGFSQVTLENQRKWGNYVGLPVTREDVARNRRILDTLRSAGMFSERKV
ncbi:MAG: hypothetical protein WC686_03575 [Candidatus Shapirobacteria bacterium]|jgi:hypothetical protein